MKIKLNIDEKTGAVVDDEGVKIGVWKSTYINFSPAYDHMFIKDQTIKFHSLVIMEINGIEFKPCIMEIELNVQGDLCAKDDSRTVFSSGRVLTLKAPEVLDPMPLIDIK